MKVCIDIYNCENLIIVYMEKKNVLRIKWLFRILINEVYYVWEGRFFKGWYVNF